MKKHAIAIAALAATLFASCKKDDSPESTTYKMNTTTSTAVWRGYLKNGYFNEGSIGVESNGITVSNGQVVNGAFRMPLSSIKNFNLPNDTLKGMLVHHLQSADFFNMALHPDLTFNIKNVRPYTGGTTGAIDSANYTVTGDLALLGKPKEISFPANVRVHNNELAVGARLKVDRTQWGIIYAADPSLPDSARIMPDIELELRLRGTR